MHKYYSHQKYVVIKSPCSPFFKDEEYLTNFSPFSHDCLTLLCTNGHDRPDGLPSWLFIIFLSLMNYLLSNKLLVRWKKLLFRWKSYCISFLCLPTYFHKILYVRTELSLRSQPFCQIQKLSERFTVYWETVTEEAKASRLAHTECEHTSCLSRGN